MGLSPIHLVILALVAVLVFGGGRFSTLMGDVAKGVKNFKSGMAEEDEAADAQLAKRQLASVSDCDRHPKTDGPVL